MALTFALVTDLHFGLPASFDGKLRKLSHLAPSLTEQVVTILREEVKPGLLVNLGDVIEDEARAADLLRYEECQRLLRQAQCPLLNVAGNHDTVNLTRDDVTAAWQRTGPLHYAVDHGGWHFVVLHTIEHRDREIVLDHDQLAWLQEDLRQTSLPVLVMMHHAASEQDLTDTRWFARAPHLALVRERASLRDILQRSGRVRAVFNGHIHRNSFDVIEGIPYVTVQSLSENLDEAAPGRPAAAFAVVRVDEGGMVVRVRGNDPARYQLRFPS